MRLLVIEDEAPMRTALVETLRAEGYRVTSAPDGISGLELACTEGFDLILLDVMMPGLDGFALCRELRKRGRDSAVLMLTAKGQVEDRVNGLDSGADDYLVKPFSLDELLARIRALLRRKDRESTISDEFSLGNARIDLSKRLLVRDGTTLELSEKEAGMLRLLASHPGETVSRERFLDVVWGYHAYPSTRTVDNFIAALRTKLEDDPARPRYLVTVRGTGYRLEP
ncbi:response regulator transcription factor [Luteolibacter sp. GHJ8]|uniref:Response regulator transcription factor n=1 Tax=Luteolibacter rhizosphaerae TaxID=2989719 RepID=A0ABT3G3H5_9BACT|nr:response regulator transcription factor [Luteolibacter rhizosphaerae]MCW1914395.1 response regulator transcription factor [Luteolibacter rhizosphaerae]